MRPLPPAVLSGSSIAFAWKALGWLERSQDPWAVCTALGLQHPGFDWFAFALGILVGAVLILLVELLLTLKLAVRAWCAAWSSVEPRAAQGKPLYKIL